MSVDWVEAAARRFEQDLGYGRDPVAWAQDKLGAYLWSKQAEIARSVADNQKTAVRACHGVGKSYVAATIMAWWIDSHPPGEAFIVSTAPSFPQVRAILWRELNKAYKKAGERGNDLPGRMNQTEWLIGNELVGYGRKPADMDPAGFQGIHAKYVLVVLDEACGIPEALWIATDALATGAECRILAIGNPDDPSSYFARVFKMRGWNKLHLNAWDSPNLTDEDVPIELRDVLVSRQWVEDKKEEWGEDSPWYIAKVLGEFPDDAEDLVVKMSDVRRCRQVQDNSPEDLSPVELGVDVAGGGQDESVIRERRGRRAGRVWRTRTPDAMKVVGLVVEAARVSGAVMVKIDSIGVGHGVASRLEELSRDPDSSFYGVRVVRVDVRKASRDPKRFVSLRDELWWDVGRVMSEKDEWDLSGVDDETLAQLTSPKYEHTGRGQIKVEAKDDTKKRIGRSPDDADALLLAFYSPKGAGWAYLEYMQRQLEKQGTTMDAEKELASHGR